MYLIKWKNLSYLQSTWEHASDINNEQKIYQYRMFNRSLDRESRYLAMQQLQRHNFLLSIQNNSYRRGKIS